MTQLDLDHGSEEVRLGRGAESVHQIDLHPGDEDGQQEDQYHSGVHLGIIDKDCKKYLGVGLSPQICTSIVKIQADSILLQISQHRGASAVPAA